MASLSVKSFLLLIVLAFPGAVFAGQFVTAASYATGRTPIAIASGDFNADGRDDLVVADINQRDVSVFIANSNGTFAAGVHYFVGLSPLAVAVGDVNGDGKLDIVVANHGYTGTSFFGTLSVLLGNGDGSFRAAIAYVPGPVFLKRLALGDVNGDGNLDVALVTEGPGGQRGLIILLGNGDGTFRPGISYIGPSHLRWVELADFNHDGKLDLAEVENTYCVNRICSGAVTTLLGNGDGTFQAGVLSRTRGQTSKSMTVADFDGDGNLDIVVRDLEGFSFLHGNGDGTFEAAVQFACCTAFTSVTNGDVNGDGILDLVASTNGTVQILSGNGDGTFQASTNYDLGLNPAAVGVADFNADGKLDVATLDKSGNHLNVDWATAMARFRRSHHLL